MVPGWSAAIASGHPTAMQQRPVLFHHLDSVIVCCAQPHIHVHSGSATNHRLELAHGVTPTTDLQGLVNADVMLTVHSSGCAGEELLLVWEARPKTPSMPIRPQRPAAMRGLRGKESCHRSWLAHRRRRGRDRRMCERPSRDLQAALSNCPRHDSSMEMKIDGNTFQPGGAARPS